MNQPDEMTHYPAGNAKARRRRRRRNLPNTQRPVDGQAEWAKTRVAMGTAEAAFDRRIERQLAWGRRGLGSDEGITLTVASPDKPGGVLP